MRLWQGMGTAFVERLYATDKLSEQRGFLECFGCQIFTLM